MSENVRGKRDGSGPFKDSYQKKHQVLASDSKLVNLAQQNRQKRKSKSRVHDSALLCWGSPSCKNHCLASWRSEAEILAFRRDAA